LTIVKAIRTGIIVVLSRCRINRHEGTKPMLELKNIIKDYPAGDGTVHALKGINLKFRHSEFVSILGQSGCGKTTMLNIIGGLDKYTDGDLVINGRSTKEYNDRDWDTYRNHTIGFVFQSYNLIPHQSVLQNVEIALSLSGVPKEERRKRATEALCKVGLESQLNKKPSEMSGGQMQRVAIARALVNDPDIILADEPTGALDSDTSIQVMDILKEISRDRLVIMVTHNPELAEKYSTRIVRMLDGLVIGDSMPVTDEEVIIEREFEKERALSEKTKKPSMSFATSFTFSLKNLFTKKGRTLLTAFAGSIGIIGIALIFAVSQGMTNYINSVQEETLSSYPVTIQAETADMTAMLSAFGTMMEQEDDAEEGTVKELKMMNQMFAQIGSNDVGSFKKYMDKNMSQIEDGINAIAYGYGVKPYIYTRDLNDNILQVNPSTIMSSMMMGGGGMYMPTCYEMIGSTEVLSNQFNLLEGRFPEKYNEVLLVLGSETAISDYFAYAIGLRDQEELTEMMKALMEGKEVEAVGDGKTYSYEELMDLEFRVIHAADKYKYNEQYKVWEDMSDDDAFAENLYENGEILEIVGIIGPKEGVIPSMDEGIAYLPELTLHIMERAGSADIVKSQLENEDIDVFTGKTFEQLKEDSKAGLDFGSMISVDTNALSSAFNMDISEEALKAAMDKAMADLEAAIPDTAEAEEDYLNTLKSLCRGMLGEYIAAGNVNLKAEDVNGLVSDYLAGSSAQAEISVLADKYAMPADGFNTTYKNLLTGILTGYVYTYSTDWENPSAPITYEAADGLASSLSSNTAAVTTAKSMALVMMESLTENGLAEKVTQIGKEVMSSLAGSFNVDGAKIASAFKFNMSEEELMRLMQTMSSGEEEERSADSNLRSLGYSDVDDPTSISVYLLDFGAKETFIDFIDSYNEDVENAGKEELVISYTDITGLLMSSIKTVIDSISYVLIAFVAISLVVSSIMIGVITLISVQERTKEIGILRALGASKRNVSSMFNAETVIIGFCAGFLGILITYLLCIPINMILHAVTGIANLSAHLPIAVGVILIFISMFLRLLSR